MSGRLQKYLPMNVIAALDVMQSAAPPSDDPGIFRAAELEAQIDAAYKRMVDKLASDADSEDEFLEFARLVGQRCQTQILKIELERRARAR